MRVIIFFDLPVETTEDRREYAKFRRYLIGQGFVRMQKSVYVKIALNGAASQSIIADIRKHKPSEGLVQVLTITEKQFQSIEYMLGESQKEIVDTLDRFVIL